MGVDQQVCRLDVHMRPSRLRDVHALRAAFDLAPGDVPVHLVLHHDRVDLKISVDPKNYAMKRAVLDASDEAACFLLLDDAVKGF